MNSGKIEERKKISNGNAQWTVTNYDAFGRTIFTGLIYRNEVDSTAYYSSIRDVFSSLVVDDSYTGFSSAIPLTVNYYDNYSFLSNYSTDITYQPLENYGKAYPEAETTADKLNATGLLTGTRVYYLDGSGNSNVMAMYYDDDAKVVQSRSTNHLGGYDLVYNLYDFTGKVLKTLKKHKIATFTIVTGKQIGRAHV